MLDDKSLTILCDDIDYKDIITDGIKQIHLLSPAQILDEIWLT